MKASIRLEHHLLAVESEQNVHAMLEIVAPAMSEGRPRPPLSLAVVIDRSGSMAGPKLETTKECASFLLRRLAPTDSLALVAYDDEVQLLAPLTPVGEGGEALLQAVQGIFPGSSTNLSGGWLKGAEVLRGADPASTRKVLLLTDGLANVGIVEPEALVGMAKQAAAGGAGTTTIGFGDDFNEDLLTAMADAGGGNAHFAATVEQAPAIFAAEFEGLVSLVAQNVSVEIRPADQVEMLAVLNDYPAVPVAGGVQVSLGDAYAEEARRLVFELHVPGLASLGALKVADVVVRYVAVGEQIAAHEITLPITVNLVSADEAAAHEADREVVEEIVVLKAARAQEDARRHADEGRLDEARRLLGDAATELRRLAPESAKAAQLLDQAGELESHGEYMAAPAMYTPEARKQMHYGSYSRRRGRPRPPA